MLIIALYAVFFIAPTEAMMGVVQRIFYFHVPSAMAGYAGFTICTAGAVIYLLTGNPRADVWARSGAEVGVLFCLFVLISGPIWAKKAWGVAWTGEPRLMLTIVVFLVYVAYLLVRSFGGQNELTKKIGSILAILGFVDIPLIRYSVQRWRGNHPQVVTGGGGGLSDPMQLAFLLSMLAIALLFMTILLARVQIGYAKEDIETLQRSLRVKTHQIEDLEL